MVATKALLAELRSRGLCVSCCDINDKLPSVRCRRCSRRAYVRERLRTVRGYLQHYKQELRHLVAEDKEWRSRRTRKRRDNAGQ